MAKRPVINTISTDVSGLDTPLNENFTNVQDTFDNTLSRDGSTPNTMNADFDMNSNDILNVESLFLKRFYINGVLATINDLSFITLEGLATYATKSLAEAASVDASVSMFYLQGYDSVGDGGGAFYTRVASEPSHEGKIQTTDGAWWEYTPDSDGVNVRAFGAVGGTSADSSISIQNAFDYAGTYNTVVFPPGYTYRIDNTVTIADPYGVSVKARGAQLKTPNDTLMFDLNGRADPTYTDNESRQFFSWDGGLFECTFTSPTKATAFRMFGFRNASLEPEEFRGFYRDIIAGGKDTLYIGRYKTFDTDTSIEFAPWSQVGGPLLVRMEDIHGSLATKTGRLLKAYTSLTDSSLTKFSANLGTNADVNGAIDCGRFVLMALTGISGSFTVGEIITGGTSGATATVVETYVHDFDFTLAAANNYKTWLVCSDRSVATFSEGETITGGTSGSTASIGNDPGYLSDDKLWQNFEISGSPHFEAGTGANGAVCVRLRDEIKRGTATRGFNINLGAVSVNGGGAVGLELTQITQSRITGIFSQTSGNTPIRFDSGCSGIKIAKPVSFSSGTIDLNGMDRDEVDLSDFSVRLTRPQSIGLNSFSVASGSTGDTTVDMSSDWANFESVGGLAPRVYGLRISLQASTSSSASSVRIRVSHPSDLNQEDHAILQIAGGADNQLFGEDAIVGADSNGDFVYDAINVGGGTVTANIQVMSAHY